jgi:hypothetical protein
LRIAEGKLSCLTVSDLTPSQLSRGLQRCPSALKTVSISLFFFVSILPRTEIESRTHNRKEERKEIAANIPEMIFVLFNGIRILNYSECEGEGDGGLNFCRLLLLQTLEALQFALSTLEQ